MRGDAHGHLLTLQLYHIRAYTQHDRQIEGLLHVACVHLSCY